MRKIIWLIIPIFIFLIIYSWPYSESNQHYLEEIHKQIDNRNKYLAYNESSPFNQFKLNYEAPTYYPIDENYKVNAQVERIKERDIISLGTSDGKEETYIKYAWLSFSLKGKSYKLVVLKPNSIDSETLFCGFADATSGLSTYGGGRYLDVVIGKSNKTVIDFNLAYNPYCAYVSDYSCPFPPTENILDIEIFAGELNYKPK